MHSACVPVYVWANPMLQSVPFDFRTQNFLIHIQGRIWPLPQTSLEIQNEFQIYSILEFLEIIKFPRRIQGWKFWN